MSKNYDFDWTQELVARRKWECFRNTNLCPNWLWNVAISQDDYDEAMGQPARNVFFKIRRKTQAVLRRVFWFWPRVTDAVYWSSGDEGKPGDPGNYQSITEDIEMLAHHVSGRATSKESAILDVGSNCGRCLAAVAELGHSNLHGVDINPAAVEEMYNIFPVLEGKCSIKRDLIQNYLTQTDDNHFEIVMTRGATLELIHPSFPLVKEICRVASSYVVIIIREFSFVYPRQWIVEFERNGFLLTSLLRPIHQDLEASVGDTGESVSLLVFRKCPDQLENKNV